jgi:hypothetical protein
VLILQAYLVRIACLGNFFWVIDFQKTFAARKILELELEQGISTKYYNITNIHLNCSTEENSMDLKILKYKMKNLRTFKI